MKNKSRLLKFALLLFVTGSVGASIAKAADTPEQRAKSFYEWYLKGIIANKNPRDEKIMFQKSVSKRLSRWVYSPAYEEYGADYFIDAQDFDENWKVATTKAVIKGNKATLKVLLAAPKGKKSLFKQTLAIKMVKEGGIWRIDSVNNRELSA